MMNIHFVSSTDGDWIGMYINGSLAVQGHSLTEREVADEILRRYTGGKSSYSEVTLKTIRDKFGGGLPNSLSVVVHSEE